MKLMNEKASLIERIQELEHITIQLSMETETIGKCFVVSRSFCLLVTKSISIEACMQIELQNDLHQLCTILPMASHLQFDKTWRYYIHSLAKRFFQMIQYESLDASLQ